MLLFDNLSLIKTKLIDYSARNFRYQKSPHFYFILFFLLKKFFAFGFRGKIVEEAESLKFFQRAYFTFPYNTCKFAQHNEQVYEYSIL